MLLEDETWECQGMTGVPVTAPTSLPSSESGFTVHGRCDLSCVPKETQGDEHEVGEDLCNCKFSLGDGAMILFSNTRLHLKRGKRYGGCGQNGYDNRPDLSLRTMFNGKTQANSLRPGGIL